MAKFEKLEGGKVKLTIEVPYEEFDSAAEKAYYKLRGRFNVPGFRKGKAPRKVIENNYGPLVFFDEAFDIIYPDAYRAAIGEHGVTPVDTPNVSIIECEPGKALVFEAEVTVKPEVMLGAYKGIEVLKREYNVTDEMVEAEIDREREKIARFIDVERPVENGDSVNLDYSGSVDGVLFEGGTAQGQTLIIGSGTFIPGFEEQMLGMAKGEERDITVTFPEGYRAEELAGKKAVFHVKVNGIQIKELPEADDEFAKDISEFDTIEELRQSFRADIAEKAEKNAKEAMENEAIGTVVENAQVDIPYVMIEHELEHMVQDFRYTLSRQGLSVEDYFEYTGTDMESLQGQMKPDAQKRVKTQLVMEAIAKAENIEADDEEVEAKIAEYASRYGDNAEALVERIRAENRAHFEDQIVLEKTFKLIMDGVVEKAKPAEDTKKPSRSKKSKA